ncbi:MAG TPA: efflux RND transporter periplasmic adaptor subunit [Pirellulaceae bacterium]|nr:efflux RND transporter periplasmic adaptor subunit [Pirellulaceae bacterium]
MSQPQISPATTAPPAAEPARPASRQLGERVRNLRLSRLPERRTPWVKIIGWIAAILIISLGGWWGYVQLVGSGGNGEAPGAASQKSGVGGRKTEDKGQELDNPKSKIQNPKSAAAPAAGEVVLEVKGYIVPRQQILVSPKVNGMILKLDVEEGRQVQKGDVLAVLESTEYQAEFDRAKANVRLMREKLRELENGARPEEILQAEAELRENEALLVQLEADWKRTDDLRRKNSVTQQEFELAESKYLAQKQRVERLRVALALWKLGPREERIEVAKADLAQAEAELVKAEWKLGNCTIRAPISGTILKKNAEEGNIVNPIAFNGSFSLCDMADLSDLEVDLNVGERDISVVKVGQKCRIRTDAWPDRVYDGYVSRLMPIADRAKAAVPVRVKIRVPAEEEGVYLKPEMGAIVTFLNEQDERRE